MLGLSAKYRWAERLVFQQFFFFFSLSSVEAGDEVHIFPSSIELTNPSLSVTVYVFGFLSNAN